MDNIHEPTDQFSFDTLKLSKPVSAPGGSYFIRFTVNNSALYIQPPKCKTKQGFLKTGKRYYTDLLFTNENDDFIRWMENLESTCHSHLFANRDKWFEGNMELHDIENYFTSPMKIYKTGKYYIVRVNVQTNLGVPALTIYDEDNREVAIDNVDNDSDVLTILEIKGIKCTATSFQIDMEMKQMLTVKPVALFTKCIIKSSTQTHHSAPESTHNLQNTPSVDTDEIVTITTIPDTVDNICIPVMPLDNDDIVLTTVNELDSPKVKMQTDKYLVKDNTTMPGQFTQFNGEPDIEVVDDSNTIDDVGELTIPTIEGTFVETNKPLPSTNIMELEEVDVNLDNLTDQDGITIKKSNDVYYEMYREACRKAKTARDLALSSYLEAKRIKNTYMLEDLTDSDESDLE